MMRFPRSIKTGLATGALLVTALACSGGTALAAGAEAPVVESGGTLSTTPSSASVYGFVNPEEQTSSCEVEFGTTTGYGSSVPCEPASLEGAEAQFVTGSLAGLEAGTAYHYRLRATNATGETLGADGEVTTLAFEAPLVDGESVSGLSSSDVTLQAQINPNYQETTYNFEYATNAGLTGATVVPGAGALPAEFAEQATSVDIGGGLQSGTTYYYRVVATNATGTTPGTVESFTTLAPPAAVTGLSQNVTRSTAMLTGSVNPAGAETTYRFAYIDQAGYEAAVASSAGNPYAAGGTSPSIAIGADYTLHAVGPLQVGELQPNTVYHYALVASNSVGTTVGPDMTFVTGQATPPLVVTGSASNVTQLSATLTGTVDARELPSTLSFEFGTTPDAGSLVPAMPSSGSGSAIELTAAFAGTLQPGTTYYYRALATNADGTSYGAEQSFTTGSFPAAIAVPPASGLIPYTSIAQLNAREISPPKTVATKPLTRAQKLSKALKACGKRPKGKRSACQRQARARYRPAKSVKKRKARS